MPFGYSGPDFPPQGPSSFWHPAMGVPSSTNCRQPLSPLSCLRALTSLVPAERMRSYLGRFAEALSRR
ncbi:hypothetical protein [Ensifer adhaerens]|uniref:hypothetical protein n=1 Tax=Ensifer adhaerens TaxID=106592 RepID=UPI00114742A0|nr:hypothetical protein [Ensifer adhaerens]